MDGHTVATGNIRSASAKYQRSQVDLNNVEGVRVPDAYLGDGNVRVANRYIVITNLIKSLKFDAKINCFDVNIPMQLILLAVGKIAYVVNLETNVLKAEMGI